MTAPDPRLDETHDPYEDEEGRALVQAIHDRKNQGQGSLTCVKPKKLS